MNNQSRRVVPGKCAPVVARADNWPLVGALFSTVERRARWAMLDELARRWRPLVWGRGVCHGAGPSCAGLIASGVVSVLRRGSLESDAVGLVVWCRPWSGSRRLLPFCRPQWFRARGRS